MTFDPESVREHCRSLRTKELLRTALVESGDLLPAAQQIWREELTARLGDLTEYIESARAEGGDEIGRVADVESFRDSGSSKLYTGQLILTTGGVAFVAESSDSNDLSAAAMLGPIFGTLYEHLLEPVDKSKNEAVPLPLLAQMYDAVFWYPAEQLSALKLEKGHVLTLSGETQLAWCVAKNADPTVLQAWSMATDVPFTN